MRDLLQNKTFKWGGIIALLLLANVVSYFWRNWGLITVHVHEVPLTKVIKSIEWQGWVKIYTNLPTDTKVTMDVDRVPLAEAMETLAANVGGQPNGAEPQQDRPNREERRAERQAQGGTPGGAGAPGAGAPGDGAQANNGSGGGGQRGGGGPGGRGGFGGGGGGGGASWNLAFFVAPTSAEVKAEIRAFESGTARSDDTLKVYSYPTPIQFLSTSEDASAADPRKQSWGGYKPPAAPPPPAAAPLADGQMPAMAATPVADATPPTPPPSTVQTYLQSFAEAADIWIMAPVGWNPDVATPPPANSSIISAVKKFVSGARGSVTQAIVLRVGSGGPRGRGGPGGAFANMDSMADRARNAINGLPPDEQPEAIQQLNEEVAFFQTVRTAPPEQRMKLVQDHMTARAAENPQAGNNRRSPEKRAQRYARSVAARQAAKGN